MCGNDPEVMPTSEEAWVKFLHSVVSLPGGEAARPFLVEKEKALMLARAEQKQKQEKEKATKQKSCSSPFSHFWKCSKHKSTEQSTEKGQSAGKSCDKQKRTRTMAEERKQQIMAKMKVQQEEFMKHHSYLLESSETKIDTCSRSVNCCVVLFDSFIMQYMYPSSQHMCMYSLFNHV